MSSSNTYDTIPKIYLGDIMILREIATAFKPKLIKFSDGKFGIRVRFLLFCHLYVDLKDTHHKWGMGSQHFKDCKGSKEKAKEVFSSLYDKYTIVN